MGRKNTTTTAKDERRSNSRDTPLYGLYGHVPLDRVCFFGPSCLNRVYHFKRVCPYHGMDPSSTGIPINYLLVNLAVADVIYSIFLIPLLIMSHTTSHPEGTTGEVLCSLLTDGTLAWVGASSSVVTLVVIAFERYQAVIYPLENERKLTTRKLKFVIPGSWILAFLLQIPQFIKKEFNKEICPNFCVYTWRKKWVPMVYFLIWLVFFVISSALMVGLYSRVVYTLWFKSTGDTGHTFQQQGVLKLRKRVTLMVVTVSAIFGICWGVDSTIHVLEDIASYKLSPLAVPIAHTMIMFNSAVNPFAYALINQRFREKMNALICCGPTSSAPRRHAAREPRDIKMARNAIPLTNKGGQHSTWIKIKFMCKDLHDANEPAMEHQDDRPSYPANTRATLQADTSARVTHQMF